MASPRRQLSVCSLALLCCAAVTLGVAWTPAHAQQVIINELDSDTVGTDALEFVELYDGGAGNTLLTGLVVVFYNGSNDLSYLALDLDGFSTNGSGYFTLGNAAVAGVDLVFGGNILQNGQDAVALYTGDATGFPNNTPVTTANLIDALVYDTADADDAGLLVLLNVGQPQIDESANGNPAADAVARCPNGSGGARNTNTYLALLPTPDGPNTNCPAPTGACCDTLNFVCTDGVTQANCSSSSADVWTEGVLCVNLNPPCAADPIGACCIDATGVCTEAQTEADCLAAGGRWGGDGSTCASINPPCVEPTGACCYAGFCADGVGVLTCGSGGGTYQGNGSVCAPGLCPAGPVVVINEIRIDEVGTDINEYFELSGPAGASLNGLTYIVIGDGAGSGTIEAVVSLTGLSIPADGHFLAVEDTYTLGGSPDLILSGPLNGKNFENTDNVTHMLVAGFSGAMNVDLDLDDDCILDATPWAGELDRIAVIVETNPPASTECHYGPPTVGPDVNPNGTFSPGHVYRCVDTTGPFVVGAFQPTGTDDTPGVVNSTCVPCGNGVLDPGEECDGALVDNCPSGICQPDCTCQPMNVPAVSEWGLLILLLLGLGFGTIKFGWSRFGNAAA